MSNQINRTVFGNNLSYYVKKAGLTQKEVADAIGVPSSYFSLWAKGKKFPRLETINKLAYLLGIKPQSLLLPNQNCEYFQMEVTLEERNFIQEIRKARQQNMLPVLTALVREIKENNPLQ